MASVSQKTDVQGQSCGACAASYVLEELVRRTFTKEDVQNLWKRVQFGKQLFPGFIEADSTDPTKLIHALRQDYPELDITGYIGDGSLWTLWPIFGNILAYPSLVQHGEPMKYLVENPAWRVIGLYKTDGLHYVATKHEKGRFHLMDSNASAPAYVAGPNAMPIDAAFSLLLEESSVSYSYLGAGILIHG